MVSKTSYCADSRAIAVDRGEVTLEENAVTGRKNDFVAVDVIHWEKDVFTEKPIILCKRAEFS